MIKIHHTSAKDDFFNIYRNNGFFWTCNGKG